MVFLTRPIHGNNFEPCPDDWIQYNDEKCFKIIDDTLRTFDEAKDVCAGQERISTLPVIRSAEEQQFLSNYLFQTQQKVENFWIGAKYSSQNNSFVWIDNSPLSNYTNWDAAALIFQNRADYCVHMQAEERVVGKWKDGRCDKKNAVICQMIPLWTIDVLQKTFLDARKQQWDAIRDLKQSLESAIQKIDEQKRSLIPIGFLYTQLPNEKAPSEIWPWMTWTDASSVYAGVFFRVVGGGAATFGQVQSENAPHLTDIQNQMSHDSKAAGRISTPVGEWSPHVVSGWVSGREFLSLKFQQSGGEVRPRNMAIRVWRRTG